MYNPAPLITCRHIPLSQNRSYFGIETSNLPLVQTPRAKHLNQSHPTTPPRTSPPASQPSPRTTPTVPPTQGSVNLTQPLRSNRQNPILSSDFALLSCSILHTCITAAGNNGNYICTGSITICDRISHNMRQMRNTVSGNALPHCACTKNPH